LTDEAGSSVPARGAMAFVADRRHLAPRRLDFATVMRAPR
jgi:hypothetical protein